MKTEVNNVTNSTDLATIKTFVVDSLAPLTSIIECYDQEGLLSQKEVLIAVKTAVQLIGNSKYSIFTERKLPQVSTKDYHPLSQMMAILKKWLLFCLDLALLRSQKNVLTRVKL